MLLGHARVDCGCRVGGYESDITRTIWFGDSPADEFRKVFNVVHDAQSAAIELGRPGTPCQDMDRAVSDLAKLIDICDNITGRAFCALGDSIQAPIVSSIRFFRRRRSRVRGGVYSRMVSNWNLQPIGPSAFTALNPDIVS